MYWFLANSGHDGVERGAALADKNDLPRDDRGAGPDGRPRRRRDVDFHGVRCDGRAAPMSGLDVPHLLEGEGLALGLEGPTARVR